jgi:Lhr-like helicase
MVRSGVTQAVLDQDVVLWRMLGAAIADLARLISAHCAASAFCDARPKAEALAARLAEAIDDQIDEPAWQVIAAEARLRTAE